MQRFDDLYVRFQQAYASRTPDPVIIDFLETVVLGLEKELRGERKKDSLAFYETWAISNIQGIYRKKAREYLAAVQEMDVQEMKNYATFNELSALFARLARTS